MQPHGAKLAIGFRDTTAVEVYDARTLKRLYAADTSGLGSANSRRRAGPWTAAFFMEAVSLGDEPRLDLGGRRARHAHAGPALA